MFNYLYRPSSLHSVVNRGLLDLQEFPIAIGLLNLLIDNLQLETPILTFNAVCNSRLCYLAD